MELPNVHFQDYPIEFKEINSSDFPYFEVENKINLTLSNGYIGDSLLENIDINEKNTVVLNCGVGSGKTTAIIKAIREFYSDETYVIFVASPFLSLVEQYYTDIIEKASIPQDDLYRHEWIGEEHSIICTQKRVHIVTINALLGNPGDDSLINSLAKRKYLNDMVMHCETNHKKVVFIYDEIHDSIHNFKEKFVFNLWKWRNVIHKNFVISATFNEASKVVIEYLAELTDCKIQILEAVREKIPERQSDLYLCFDNAKNYSNENGNLVSIIEDVLSRGMDLDILCYSKKLCKSILENKETGAGKLLFEKYEEENINDCTSGLDDNERLDRNYNKNRYKNSKCNIGTNYKSGVSIEKENHAFILIFPPYTASGNFKPKFGIFTGGANSIIQALARKRKVGEIHIILPRPTVFNFSSFPFTEDQRLKFKEHFEALQNSKEITSENDIEDRKQIEYIPSSSHDELLSSFYYDKLKGEVLDCVEYIEQNSESRADKIRLLFPEYKLFKLEDGEKYLSNEFKFIGRDLSGYVCYAAATNQFVNCNWVGSNWKPIQNFKENKLQHCFDKFYDEYFYEDELNKVDWFSSLMSQVTNQYVYSEIRNKIFDEYNIKFYFENGDTRFIQSFENKLFETQLMAFIQRKLFRINEDFVRRYEQHNGWTVDAPYTRGDYFKSCIAHAHLLNHKKDLSEETRRLVTAYRLLDRFRNKIIDSIQTTIIARHAVRYISKIPNDSFVSQDELEDFRTMIETLCNDDLAIKYDLFDFKRIFSSKIRENKKVYRFYTYLKEDFFILRTRKIENIDRDMVVCVYDIPAPNKVLDFISHSEITLPEEAMQELVIIDGIPVLKNTDGSFTSFGNSPI